MNKFNNSNSFFSSECGRFWSGWKNRKSEGGRVIRKKEKKGGGRMKRVVARDEGSRHLWKALMRRYRPGRHCRLRKRFPLAGIIA